MLLRGGRGAVLGLAVLVGVLGSPLRLGLDLEVGRLVDGLCLLKKVSV